MKNAHVERQGKVGIEAGQQHEEGRDEVVNGGSSGTENKYTDFYN